MLIFYVDVAYTNWKSLAAKLCMELQVGVGCTLPCDWTVQEKQLET